MKSIIFIAPPAAGKGTISDYLVENYGYKHISTGDILRNMAKSETELGSEIKRLMQEGKLIGDDIILPACKMELEKYLDKPFILDGIPRNLHQADELEKLFQEWKMDNYIVINLEIDKEILLKRATGRRVCENCKTGYNVYFDTFKPRKENICDKCGSTLMQREDDKEDTFKKRFTTFIEETAPVLDFYEKRGLLKTVDANKSIDEIRKQTMEFVGVKND